MNGSTLNRGVRAASSDTSVRRHQRSDAHLYYVYCITDAGVEVQRLLDTRAVEGLVPGEPLYAVADGGLLAAVSRVPASQFQERSLNERFQDISTVAPLAVRHNAAIQALRPAAVAIVPLSLGVVYQSEANVRALLTEQAPRFRTLLGAVRGKDEWGVKIFCDKPRLQSVVEAESEQLRQASAEMTSSTPGRAYLLRKKMAQLRREETARVLTSRLEAAVQRLSTLSDKVKVDDLPEAPDPSSAIVLKAAFLVTNDRASTFHAAIAELRQQYLPWGMQVEVNGPWAPYSFIAERWN